MYVNSIRKEDITNRREIEEMSN